MSAGRNDAVASIVHCALVMLCMGAGSVAYAQGQSERESSTNMKEIDAIPYASPDGQSLYLDLYLPDGVEAPPLLVWVHGGAWQYGERKPLPTTAFVDDGYAIASIDFRLSSVAPFPAQVYDIKAAIRFLRANAGRYGYDATRVGILGASSGGHLAALTGTTNGEEALEGMVGDHLDQSSAVQAIVSYFGASNLTTILEQSTPFGLKIRVPALELLLGGPPEEKVDLARLASPVYHVDVNDPPLFLLHGDQDPQMPINQSHELYGAYKAKGLVARFEVVYGAAHGGDAFFDAARNAAVRAFLDEHIRGITASRRTQ